MRRVFLVEKTIVSHVLFQSFAPSSQPRLKMALDVSTSSSSSFPPSGVISAAATTAVDLVRSPPGISNPPSETEHLCACAQTDGDGFLTVDISDALSERDWVKFTVHTKTSMTQFAKAEFSVIRLHEEFIW